MHCRYACRSAAHAVSRRRFLGGLLAGSAATALGRAGTAPAPVASELATGQKRLMVIFLHGGVSQLESWDPKPGTDTGGPFLAIPTSVPGLHVSELLPHTARVMHHLAVVRGVNTAEDDHGKGAYLIDTGRRETPAARYPGLGCAVSKLVAPEEAAVPSFVRIAGGYDAGAAFLGPRHAGVGVGAGGAPANLHLPQGLTPEIDAQRHALRRAADQRFAARRRTAETEAYGLSFEQATRLLERREMFDLSREPEADHERYGKHDFGQQCLMARRLLEQGVTCVKVSHTNYDTHNENFDFHLEQLGEFDRTFACLVSDLVDRGLWSSTLLLVLSEFGRTPHINHLLGRDHWSKAWSVVLGGRGIQAGAVLGRTNDNGTEVVERQVNAAELHHTYLHALGVDTKASYEIDGKELPVADPAHEPIRELLA